jgi:hypothetical protein
MISKYDANKVFDPTKTPSKMPPSRSFEILEEIHGIDILVLQNDIACSSKLQ